MLEATPSGRPDSLRARINSPQPRSGLLTEINLDFAVQTSALSPGANSMLPIHFTGYAPFNFEHDGQRLLQRTTTFAS
jgi:hypothetical protein